MGSRERGFTLVELLVVLVIVLMVSVVAIPAAYHAYSERGIQEGVQLVQAAIATARDEAVRAQAPRGIRFLADPTVPNASSRIIPLEPAPDYSEGLATTFPAWTYDPAITGGMPCLVVEQRPFDAWVQNGTRWSVTPVNATSWWGNVRVGDQIRIGGVGRWMTVCGPAAVATSEGFAGASSPLGRDYTSPDGTATLTFQVEYLLLVNGADDDGNGFVDDGWDGIDNDNNGMVDDALEWEAERWPSGQAHDKSPYLIRRRPVPGKPVRGIDLPASVVVDSPPADFLVQPTGEVVLVGPYGTPSSYAMTGPAGDRSILHELRIHLVERGAGTNEGRVVVNIKTGQVAADVGP